MIGLFYRSVAEEGVERNDLLHDFCFSKPMIPLLETFSLNSFLIYS